MEVQVQKGDRVRLIHTADQYTFLQPGDEGTVRRVSHPGGHLVISIEWDDGSTLSMLPDDGDRIEVI